MHRRGGIEDEVMDRHSEALRLAEELLTDVELSRCKVQQLVLKASRLARVMQDDQARVWLGFELNGYPSDPRVADLVTHMGRWVDDAHEKAYLGPLTQMSAIVEAQEQKLVAMRGASFAGEYGSIAAREHQAALNAAANQLASARAVEGNVTSAVYTFVAQTYDELLFSDLQSELFAAAQGEIDARLASLAGQALNKIESVRERLRARDLESVSQAMSTCRRLIDAAADALFPARDDPYMLGDQPLAVKKSNVLNRLQAYAADRQVSKGRRDRLRRTFADLYERVSSGTHADVDVVEARYLFLQTYVALGEVLALPTGAPD